MSRILFAGIMLAAVLAGCSGERGLTCESGERYQNSISVGPIRVPDDLSVPDESESLTIPPGPYTLIEPPASDRPCLESPPDFFEGGEVGAG
jgi:uncharacterized lipoprotein